MANVQSCMAKESTLERLSYLCKAKFFGQHHVMSPNTAKYFLANPFTFLCHPPSTSCSISLQSISLKFQKCDGLLSCGGCGGSALSGEQQLACSPRRWHQTLWRALLFLCPAACRPTLNGADVEQPWKAAT